MKKGMETETVILAVSRMVRIPASALAFFIMGSSVQRDYTKVSTDIYL